jgi:competence protein ComEC
MNPRPMVPPLLAYVGGAWIGHTFAGIFPDPLQVIPFLALLPAFPLVAIPFLSVRAKSGFLLAAFLTVGVLLDLMEHRPSNLFSPAKRGEELTIEGTVDEPVTVKDDYSRLAVRIDSAKGADGAIQGSGRMLVHVYSHSRVFPPGERILFPAKLRSFRNFNNPDRYDYELAMRAKGFVCAASVSDGRVIVPLGRGSLGFIQDGLETLRSPLRRFMQEKLWPQQAALFRALILGEPQDMGPELRDLFTSTGLGHVIAVSGLNIGFVAWLVFLLLKRLLSLSYRWTLRADIRTTAALITCVPVIGYSLLAGFEVSVQRAMIMVLAYLLAVVLGREEEVWSTLALAALLILTVHPHELYSISFQLSFGGVIGLVVLLPQFRSVLARVGGGRLPRYLVGLVMSTVAATLFLLPLLLYHFSRISLVTVPANLLVLPFIGFWIIPLGLLAAMLLPISGLIAGTILQLGGLGIDLTLMVMQFFADLDWAELWVIRPSVLEIGLCYTLLVCVVFLQRGKWARPALFALLAFLAGDVSYWIRTTQFNPGLKVTYLDVGGGSASLIQFPGRERMLIDGGGSSREDFDIGKMVVAPALLALKIRRVDYLVLSHPDSDHMNGLRFIASHFGPREFWHNGDGVGIEEFRGLEETIGETGMTERLPEQLREPAEISGVRVELLHPEWSPQADPPPGRRWKLNDRSMVLKFTHGGHSFLFAGDLERVGEEELIERNGERLRSDVLLVPHHGSRGSTSAEFLERVSPRICVISARGGTPLRHPHPELIRRLEERGCTILRTDQHGAITVSSSGERLEIEQFNKSP